MILDTYDNIFTTYMHIDFLFKLKEDGRNNSVIFWQESFRGKYYMEELEIWGTEQRGVALNWLGGGDEEGSSCGTTEVMGRLI